MRVALSASICLALVALAGAAHAQQAAGGSNHPAGADRSNSQFTLRREEAGGAAGATARARARAGDCAGALPEFDTAIRSSIDPALRRDRGLCHEKLGDPFPAIDDYRVYLTARPDAPDSDQIRQRLAALEGAAGPDVQARSTEPTSASDASVGATASMSAGAGGASAKASSTSSSSEHQVIGPKPGEQAHPYDYYTAREKENAMAKASPLRYGSGFILGPFINVPRIFLGDGATTDIGFAAGATLRYSTGRLLTLVSEFGFSGAGKGGEVGSQSGPLVMGGLELRFPISALAGDHLLLRGGVGYERNVIRGTRATLDEVLGRFAFGYRHVFATAVGLEALVDGGPVVAFPEGEDSRVNGVVGLSVALVVGF